MAAGHGLQLLRRDLAELLGQLAAAAARMGGSSNGHSEQEEVLGLDEDSGYLAALELVRRF